jgi:regulator of RNase E activity RraB
VLNLRYDGHEPPATATTLYRVRLPMREPDEHGMGTAAEAAYMNAFEDEVARRAGEAELIYVGRIRSRADWELVFYGAPDRNAAVQAIREEFVDRRTYVDVRPDADWGYYREFLLPDAERRRWMHDRRLVEVLTNEGDALTTPRRVDHRASFTTAEARDRFVVAATQAGFELQRAAKVQGKERPFGAQVYRVDAVDLEHIHDVVMQLVEIAEREGGDYDGWETAVERG